MKKTDRRKGLRAKRKTYVAPHLKKGDSLRQITAQGTSRTDT